MLSRAGRRLGSLANKSGIHHSKRYNVVISPAINDTATELHLPVMPFGFDFVGDNLRQLLESRNVDVDALEKKYNNQIQNDAEFNNPALPSQGSKLWGFIYAQRLVRAKVQLKTLTKNEEFMTNYLRAQISELEQRMNRYYPSLDWRGEYESELARARESVDENFENGKNEAIATIVSQNGGDDSYVALFGNNSFIDSYDENDKFNDMLPANLEEKLINRFEFYYDHSSDNVDPSKYFDTIRKIEKTIDTPLNALSKELRSSFSAFMLNAFASNNLTLVSNVVDTLKRGSATLASDDNATVDKCLSLLDVKSGKVSANSAGILAKLFFGNGGSAQNLSGKDVSQVSSVLASSGQERVSLIYDALQMEASLKQNSVGRILLTLALQLNRNFMSQFLTSDENIDAFASSNSSAMDEIVSAQKAFYQSQEKLSQALSKFCDSLVNAVAKDKQCNKDDLSRFVTDSVLNGSLPNASNNVGCVLADGLRQYSDECQANGDTFGALKGLTYAKYLEYSGESSSLGWYELFNGLLNPPRNGLSGNYLSRIANVVSNDTSKASDAIFGSVGQFLQENGLLNENDSGSIASTLSGLVSGDFDALKTACGDFEQARVNSENALKSVSLNMDGQFHFDHVVDTYDPLNIHLAQYRYLTPN